MSAKNKAESDDLNHINKHDNYMTILKP